MAKVLHTCTECVPIDASIIDTYVALVETNRRASTAEDEREVAEAGRVSAEEERTRVFTADHGTAADDHTIAAADHGTAGEDHRIAGEDHATAVDDHAAATGDLADINAAISRANSAASAAEHMVDIHQGPTGATPNISIGTVSTGAAGSPAEATMTGTPENPVLNMTIPQGDVGATPDITIGTVTTGAAGSQASASITGTAAAPVLNLTIPQGIQGNTGSSVDYPYELVNNATTNDATKGATAAVAKALKDETDQLSLKMFNLGELLVPLLKKIAYEENDAKALIDSIYALLNTDELLSISAVYTQPGAIYVGEPLNDLRTGLIVTATYASGISAEILGYTLSGTLAAGTSAITVTYREKTTTFNVNVTDAVYYLDGALFGVRVGNRSSVTTSGGLGYSYVRDGVTYVFTNDYTKSLSSTTKQRCSYFLFDILLTAGKTYKFIVEFISQLTSNQTILAGLAYFDSTFKAAGDANVYQTQDFSSHISDAGWQATTKDGNKVSLNYTTPDGYVGTRFSMKLQSSGSDIDWPTALLVDRFIIQEVTE